MRKRAPSSVVDHVLDAPGVAVIARVLLTSPFWVSAGLKAADPSAAAAEVVSFGLRPAALFAALVILVQAGGSAAVILGRSDRLGAAVLIAFTVLASLIGHAFWLETDAAPRLHELNAFLANIGLTGGLVLAAVLSHRSR